MLVNFLRSGRTLLFLMGVAFGFVAVARAQAPAISKQPVSVTVVAGNPASFSVVATGAAPLSYQWRKDGNVIPVATGPTLSFLAATGADAGVYRVTVTSLAISVTSDTVTLTVNLPPTITTQPLAQTTTLGGAVTLRVVATGMGILTYQWYRNGETLAEATGASYNIPSASAADAGAYTVQIGNSFGQVTSVPAQVGFSGMLWAVGFNANGALGDGNGITKQYGMGATPTYHDDRLRQIADGEIFNTITNGKNNMLPYADKLLPQDRWAVVAYVRALQRAQMGAVADVPEEHTAELGIK